MKKLVLDILIVISSLVLTGCVIVLASTLMPTNPTPKEISIIMGEQNASEQTRTEGSDKQEEQSKGPKKEANEG